MENLFFTYFYLIVNTLQLVAELSFFSRFVNFKIRKIQYLLFIITFYALFYACQDWNIPSAGSIISIILMTAFGIFSFRAKFSISILSAIVIAETMQISFGLFTSLTGLISPFLYDLNPMVVSRSFMVGGGILSLSLFVLCCLLVCRKMPLHEMKQTRYAFFLLMPMLLVLFVSDYISNTIYSDTIVILHGEIIIDASHVQMLVIQLFCLFSLFCTIFVYHKLLKSIKLNAKLSMMEQEVQFQQTYVSEAQSRYEETKSFRHDIKVITDFLEKEEPAKALSYVNELDGMTADFTLSHKTNNPVVDILLNSKANLAANKGIRVTCSAQIPSPCPISDIDLCVVVSNAMDNSIAECEDVGDDERRYIKISSGRQGDFYMLEFINGCTITPLDLKKGTGLLNIDTVAEKYHGTVNMKQRGTSFTLSILFNTSQQAESLSPPNS